jgi:pyruvate formate lyase activating enzyme
MNGIITDIHRTSLVDGPGIRTTVFLKGCLLRCIWCHNPETQNEQIEAGYGRIASVDEIVAECLKDRIYYEESGGGVTLSGGEPLVQPEFSLEILQRLKSERIHTVLDTTGYAPQAIYEQTLPLTDLYLFDYKVTDPQLFEELIGEPPGPIPETLDFLIRNGAAVLLRCPLIPGVNDDEPHLAAIAEMEQKYPSLEGIDILPWHTMGNAKYAKLGRAVDPRLPKKNVPKETNDYYRKFFAAHGALKITVKD